MPKLVDSAKIPLFSQTSKSFYRNVGKLPSFSNLRCLSMVILASGVNIFIFPAC